MNISDDELEALLGAYALDAVDQHEREAVEHYLERSATAREEVRNHHEVAMALATTPGQAPEALWNRIEASMQTHGRAESLAAPAPEDFGVTARSLPRFGRSRKLSGVSDVSGMGVPGRVGRGSARGGPEKDRTYSGSRWVAAAAAVLVASIASVSVGQHRTIKDLRSNVAAAQASAESNRARADRIERLLTTATAKDRVIKQLLATSGTSVAHLDTPKGVLVVDVILASDGQGYLVSRALPTLSSGRTYQLWGVANDVVLSLGIFGSAPKTLEFAAHEQWTKFVLTEEQSPGVPTSSQPAVAVGEVQHI